MESLCIRITKLSNLVTEFAIVMQMCAWQEIGSYGQGRAYIYKLQSQFVSHVVL